MIKPSVICLSLLLAAAMAAGAPPATAPASAFQTSVAFKQDTQIDKLVFARLQQLNIQPANLCSDAVFVRRAYLDVIGTLPTAQDTKDFLQDRNPDKRRILIDRLLDGDGFADYWAMKWSDLLRVKAEFPINLWPNAAQTYHRWIWASIRENKPYDRFVRELLTASGSNFRAPPVNFYRAVQSREPQALAQAVALTFMGTRADKWPADRLSGMAGFFSLVGYKYTAEWKEEIIFFDPNKGGATTKPAIRMVFPDGTPAKVARGQDPREVFADWLVSDKNPWFARCAANRVWGWLLGRGIINEVDDIRPDNPPSNPELLAFLERELIAGHYDLKRIYRLILNSSTYQQSCIGRSADPQAEANFACYPVRRLEAEVLADALCQITGTTENYTSAIPEPFTFIPQDQRSVTLPDGSISSSFLELFGRATRDTGQESDRNNRLTADQRLHLLNSSHIQKKLEQSPLIRGWGYSQQSVTDAYLTILSRYPTEEELKIVKTYSQSSTVKGKEAMVDLTWALVNSSEFLYRH